MQILVEFNSNEPLVNYKDSKLKLTIVKPSQNLTIWPGLELNPMYLVVQDPKCNQDLQCNQGRWCEGVIKILVVTRTQSATKIHIMIKVLCDQDSKCDQDVRYTQDPKCNYAQLC